MLIVNQIENTHFSKTEREIVDYIIDQGMNIEKMSANEIARNTFTSAPLLVRIAKKLGYSGFNEFKSAYLKELAYMLEETDVDASIPFLSCYLINNLNIFTNIHHQCLKMFCV